MGVGGAYHSMIADMTTLSSPLYDWTGASVDRMPDRIQIGASAFILDAEGRLLLLLRADCHHWAMPGGRQDIGESITTTCVREVYEETGFHVRVKQLIGIYSDPRQYLIARYPDGELVQMLNVCFACEIIGGQMTASPESITLSFFALDALPEPMLLTHKIRIQDALVPDAWPVVR